MLRVGMHRHRRPAEERFAKNLTKADLISCSLK